MAARPKSASTSPRRTRTAANAGPRPLPVMGWVRSAAIRSGGPREVRRRQAGLSLVLDAEGVDARSLRLGHGQVRRDRVEHPGESHRFTGLDPERHNVLDLEVDAVADTHGVA